ncbi:MAG TPA: ATP-binding protein [Bryobacteraceae bacterium]|nr:ATP-binding protein [Bryobacteraceae bacterium]
MHLRAQLTLWLVLVMALIVGIVGAFDLAQEITNQFEFTKERADICNERAREAAKRALDRNPAAASIPEALRKDAQLPSDLVEIMTAKKSPVIEIAVCDPQGGILADTGPISAGNNCPVYPDFEPLVNGSVNLKRQVLTGGLAKQSYQVSLKLAAPPKQNTVAIVRAIVLPGLIKTEITPTFQTHAQTSILLLMGSIVAAFVFSAIAFRPIGKLGKMLDSVTKGEFEIPPALPAAKAPADEFSIVASKVNLLGQQLRGAQYDFSDLRGNFERLLDDLEDAVLVFGRDRRLVVAAGAVERFLGRERAELMGKTLIEIFPAATSLGLLLQKALQSGESIRNQRVPIAASGNGGSSVPVALLSVDVLEALPTSGAGASGAGILVRLRDPEATRQIGKQLQTAERLSAISRITGGVAHEVKNPLNAILMHVELARMKMAKGDHDLTAQMDIIGSEIVRLDRVVKTFLDFTRPVELHLTEVPLEAFVNDIAELARPLAEMAKISVSVEQQAGNVGIAVDLDLLKQAMLNLVMNALEAMPDGGDLRFESSVRGDDAEIRVSDTGCGIPPELKSKVFGLYFTTKPKGSGIGLAMTFRIVQLHDGTIDFTSEPGKGATFIIRIPTAASSS